MYVTLVHVKVKPEFLAPFIEITHANHAASVREKGNRRFDVLQLAEDPTLFVLVEAYATPEDAAAHKQTPHYAAWKAAVADWMAEPRRGEPMQGLYPA